MTLRNLAEEIAEDIQERLAEYLEKKERELQERTKAGVKISQTWGGYEIMIAGHRITAEHDSSMHRWRFRVVDRDYEEFFSISEKKGQAIVDFLKAVSEAINPSFAALDRGEKTFGGAAQDPATGSEETIAGATVRDPVFWSERIKAARSRGVDVE